MITRAIIELKLDEYTYKVRIPIFDRSRTDSLATPMKDLCNAVASLPKGIFNSLLKDDVVIVGFEDNELGSPIIIGQLYRQALNTLNQFPLIKCDALEVLNQAILPTNFKIGNITYDNNLFYLEGVEGNVQDQLNQLKLQIKVLDEKIAKL